MLRTWLEKAANVIEKRLALGAQQSVSVVTGGAVPARYGGPPHARLHYQCG
jgi:hypothetical protein